MLLIRPLFALLANALALFAAGYLLSGFVISGGYVELLWLAVALTLLNFFVKPLLKLLLGPVILLSLGLALLFVNALVLYLLDLFSENLTITGVQTLLVASLVIGAVNLIFHFFTKR